MAYFTKDILDFFTELSENNHKEWFDANRKRYEKSVKEPFKSFIADLIATIQQDDAAISIQAKDAIFRINRDIRFSKDKTPYKTQSSAIICEGSKKDHMKPGLYIEINTYDFRIYGGLYAPEPDMLHKVRQEIAYNLEEFEGLVNDPLFVKHFGTMRGEQNKRLPKEYEDVLEKQPLIANKQFYYFAKLPADTILKDNLIDIIMTHYFAGKPMKQFLARNLE